MEKRILPNEILLSSTGEFLAEGREVTLMVKGNSMLPFLHSEKDSVVLRKKNEVTVGDIVLARIAKGHYVMHRIWQIDGNNVTLMGDGNLYGTENCTADDILGTVIRIERPDGSEEIPGNGRLWRKLLPIRRYLLAIYRRIPGKI